MIEPAVEPAVGLGPFCQCVVPIVGGGGTVCRRCSVRVPGSGTGPEPAPTLPGSGRKVMAPLRPRTSVTWTVGHERLVLVLDNGVRIESRNPAPDAVAGAYILVADADGLELGYWNAEEWGAEPHKIMEQILVCAATGRPVEQGS